MEARQQQPSSTNALLYSCRMVGEAERWVSAWGPLAWGLNELPGHTAGHTSGAEEDSMSLVASVSAVAGPTGCLTLLV